MQASVLMQQRIRDALAAAPALAGVPVFDGPPADARPPYLTLGAETVTLRSWQGGGTAEHRFQVNLWDARDGVAPAKALMAGAIDAVLAMDRLLPGGRMLVVQLVKAAVKPGGQRWTQGLMEFRALVVMED